MDYALERKVPAQRWWRIIPPTILIYTIAYMDRMNISFAMAGGMNESLGLSLSTSGLAAGIFFLGYLFLQIPGGHYAEHGSAKKFICWTIVFWGGLSICNGFVQNEWQLLTIRFLLGVAEGGLYPALLVVISNWFPAKEVGRANALFMSSLSLSAIVTNPLAGWILSNFSWQGLFVIEGLISLSLLVICMPFLADSPASANWISKEEKDYLQNEMEEDRAALELSHGKKEKNPGSYKDILKDKSMWILISLYICTTAGQYGFTIWLPTIIKNLTKMGMTNVGFLSALPFLVSVVGLYIFAYFSDKSMNRRLYTALSLACFAVSLWVSTLFSTNIWMSYGLLVVTGLFIKSMQCSFWTIPAILFPPGKAGGARGIINAVGNLGGFIGPYMVGVIASGYGMNAGVYSLVAIMLLGAAITMLLPRSTAGQMRAASK
jgi:MFS family permease